LASSVEAAALIGHTNELFHPPIRPV